ncbi:hypothetical protein RYH73_11050 [Olivibacter sp. CPCC 100613]|uniref:hypothetical protein n=1 Tax=Olivibacter sp. CPCC 100613 TaxID=3079931 RepID=UPI002FFB11C7
MRHLQRLGKPQILVDKEVQWTEKFIESNKDRPNSKQYGHNVIKETLCNISHNKCFYSEVKFAGPTEAQVDHYIEVSEDKTKAFEWENLYLSHKESNIGKPSNIALPNSSCLDPFLDEDTTIEANLHFEDEQIFSLSERGLNTIKKYKLNKPIYDTMRTAELKKFNKIIYEIALQNRELNDELRDILTSFAMPDRPFSLMFKKLLTKHGLL